VRCRQVKDDSRALTLGALTLPLARLLTASELTLDQWFQLSSSGPNSRLYMKLVMRVWLWRKRWGLGDLWTLWYSDRGRGATICRHIEKCCAVGEGMS
jgi:hypothetical protein